MSDLSLVINLGSSSLKAALVDSTGACLRHSGAVWPRPWNPIFSR